MTRHNFILGLLGALFGGDTAMAQGVAGAPGNSGGVSGTTEARYGTGGGTSATYHTSIIIDTDLEPDTRRIALAMGGPQPSENEWAQFFFRGTNQGGSMQAVIHEKMTMAHAVARQFELTARRDRASMHGACGGRDEP